MQNYPVIIEASCVLSDDGQSALLHLRGHITHCQHLTIIHEGVDVAKYEQRPDESCERLVVRHGECIVIFARFQGEVIAMGAFQVNLGLYGDIASVLLPLGSGNLEFIQASVESARVEVAA